MLKEAINKLIERTDLDQQEIEKVMELIMSGQVPPAQIASFLTAFRMKGETVNEITGCVRVMRRHVVPIKPETKKYLLDTCGTGGDRSHTFNISTVSALICAGSGALVAKHGNRAVSSKCGSADLLKELGVNIEIAPDKVGRCIDDVGIGFLYAPLLHPAMKFATPVRREMGIRTVFNILGPLTNPASARNQLLGVYDSNLTEPLAEVLGRLGSIRAFVVHGADGLDEVTTTDETIISELKNKAVTTYKIIPEDFGIKRAKPEELKGEGPAQNKKITLGILKGDKGPCRDIAVLNAGCAICAAGLAQDIKTGVDMANESIDSGRAMQKLKDLIAFTTK